MVVNPTHLLRSIYYMYTCVQTFAVTYCVCRRGATTPVNSVVNKQRRVGPSPLRLATQASSKRVNTTISQKRPAGLPVRLALSPSTSEGSITHTFCSSSPLPCLSYRHLAVRGPPLADPPEEYWQRRTTSHVQMRVSLARPTSP